MDVDRMLVVMWVQPVRVANEVIEMNIACCMDASCEHSVVKQWRVAFVQNRIIIVIIIIIIIIMYSDDRFVPIFLRVPCSASSFKFQ